MSKPFMPLDDVDGTELLYPDLRTPDEPAGFFYPVGKSSRPPAPIKLKNAAAFAAEYVPLRYTIEPIIRSASIYTNTAKTGAGKTVLQRCRCTRRRDRAQTTSSTAK